MRTWWKRFWQRFLNDEAFFVGVIRSAIMTVAAGGMAYAQQVADAFGGAPRVALAIRGVAVVSMGLAMFMRAGDKNESDDQLRERLARLGVAPAAQDASAAPPGAGFARVGLLLVLSAVSLVVAGAVRADDPGDAVRLAVAEANLDVCAQEAELLRVEPLAFCAHRADQVTIVRLALATAAASTTYASTRSPATVRAFRRANPCPATGKTTGACPGWVVDHRIPLCAGGPDDVRNMTWQAKADAAWKDGIERALCARLARCTL